MTAHNVHPAARDSEELLQECEFRRFKASGPGGQRRNKVETAVALTHRPSGVEAEAGERRSQAENRRTALKRLRLNLALQVRFPVDAASSPSALWQSRCRNGKIRINAGHVDFPALLAEALDAIFACEFDVRPAAEHLGCTSSQLVKLLKLEPRALATVNEHRRERGLRPLK